LAEKVVIASNEINSTVTLKSTSEYKQTPNTPEKINIHVKKEGKNPKKELSY